MDMWILNLVLLFFVVVFAILAVELRNLLRSAISLGVSSALLAAVFYALDAPYAGIFELSVVAGLITVLFASIITLTKEGVGEG